MTCCFIILILNFIYIIKSKQSVVPDVLHCVAIASTFCGIASTFYIAFGMQNYFHANKDCKFLSTLMNKYCDIGWRISFVCIILQIYGFIIFLLSQIRNLSTHLPSKYQIKSKIYTLLVIILVFVAFSLCLYLMYDHHVLRMAIVETIDNKKYKYCWPMEAHRTQTLVLIIWSCMTITIICIFIGAFTSYKQLKPISNDIHISQFNKKEIKRVLYDILKFIVSLFLFFLISEVYNIVFFPQNISLVISVIILCNLHRNYKHDIRELNQYKYLNQQLQLVNIATSNGLINSNSQNTVHSNSTMDELDVVSSCDLLYKYQNGLQFIIADEFIENAKCIFTTLNDLFYIEFGSGIYHILQEISAFAATQFEPCMDCGTNLPLIECDKDYNMEFGVMSMLDQYENIKYYINQNDNNVIEVLCRFCATKRGVLSNFMLLPTLSKTFQILRVSKQQ
eukprot:287955_1